MITSCSSTGSTQSTPPPQITLAEPSPAVAVNLQPDSSVDESADVTAIDNSTPTDVIVNSEIDNNLQPSSALSLDERPTLVPTKISRISVRGEKERRKVERASAAALDRADDDGEDEDEFFYTTSRWRREMSVYWNRALL